ncbi:MAG: hypothetical protein MJZ75_01755 [Paludibacteraceae bacterium]|nr:hypothetical protein [Paludibacteraceae bacterium]
MKRTFILFLVALLGAIGIQAAGRKMNIDDAIYMWVNGSSVCYRLSQMPQIKFVDEAFVLLIDGVEQLRVKTSSLEDITMTYGVYQSSTPTDDKSVSTTDTPVQKVGKYITGGRLIIVKDGKQYDAKGHLISNK